MISIRRQFGTSLYKYIFEGETLSFSQNVKLFIELGKSLPDCKESIWRKDENDRYVLSVERDISKAIGLEKIINVIIRDNVLLHLPKS